MKLAILGATGATGKLLVDQALAAGHTVTALARNPADITLRHPALTVVQAEATQQVDMERVLAGHDAVLSAVGSRTLKKNTVRSDAARAVVAAMQKLGLKRLVWLSAAGVGDSADQARRSNFVFGRIIMPLVLAKVYADADIADRHIIGSGLDAVVVRPVGLNNKGLSGRIEVVPLAQKLPRSYISRADVAKFMLEQASSETYLRQQPVIC